MKKSILTIILLSFLLPVISQTKNSKDYSLKIKRGESIKTDNKLYWIIPITLTNRSKDTLKYFSMNCSWEYYYSVNNKSLQIAPKSCFSNFPIIVDLAPKESTKAKLKLLVIDTMGSSHIRFRVGMNLSKADNSISDRDNLFGSDGFSKIHPKGTTIWSNAITMKK